MRVTEIFYSLQGEGMLAGAPSVFVRLAGCPFRCRWCDTAYAWEYTTGEDLDVDQIVERIRQWPCRHIVLTGGEPMIGPDLSARPGLAELTHRLRALGKHITIETAGVLFTPDLPCDLMSISPKLSNSRPSSAGVMTTHLAGTVDVKALSRLINAYPYQLKFVIESPENMYEIHAIVDQLGSVDTERVMLMPEARNREELLARSPMVAALCKEAGFRFSQRLHILLWGNQRNT
jgi:7-carboxy-7-deazaguanine synthase